VFENSPSLLVRMIGAFSSIWFYGHGWFSPVYYGVLLGFALWAKDRFALGWLGSKPTWLFVFGVSVGHGALCAALLCIPFLFMTPSGAMNPIFLVLFVSNVYALQALTRSVIRTWRNDLTIAIRLLRKGLITALPSILMMMFFASNFADSN
jgi:hypothetical protein